MRRGGRRELLRRKYLTVKVAMNRHFSNLQNGPFKSSKLTIVTVFKELSALFDTLQGTPPPQNSTLASLSFVANYSGTED